MPSTARPSLLGIWSTRTVSATGANGGRSGVQFFGPSTASYVRSIAAPSRLGRLMIGIDAICSAAAWFSAGIPVEGDAALRKLMLIRMIFDYLRKKCSLP